MLLLKNMSTIEHVEKRDPTKKDQVNPFDLGKEKNWVQVPCLSTCVHSETNMYAHMRIASRTLCCLLFFGMLHHATARARRHTHLTHTHTHAHKRFSAPIHGFGPFPWVKLSGMVYIGKRMRTSRTLGETLKRCVRREGA